MDLRLFLSFVFLIFIIMRHNLNFRLFLIILIIKLFLICIFNKYNFNFRQIQYAILIC